MPPHPDPRPTNFQPCLGASTPAVRAGIGSDAAFGAVTPPIYLSSNFTFAGFAQPRAFDYTRSGNPTRAELERALCELEGGAGAVCTSSGMSAVTLALHAFALERHGSGGQRRPRVLAQRDIYGGTHRLLSSFGERGLFELEFVDLADAVPDQPDADLIWVETPSNPLLRVVDVQAVARAAGKARVLVDNTFLSPALQNPIALGAHAVLHSTTKSLNGHSDVVGGALILRDREDAERCAWWANCLGLSQSPFDSFLVLRGLRTLNARWTVHEANARALAERLAAHPAVDVVHYPGLKAHPHHARASAQQRGFGSIISIQLKNGLEAAKRFVESLRLFALAESLGGVESLVAHPATMTHAAMDPKARNEAGIGDDLVRLSVGIEDLGDLERDLDRALAATRGEPDREGRSDPEPAPGEQSGSDLPTRDFDSSAA